jgi:hypothetical protein
MKLNRGWLSTRASAISLGAVVLSLAIAACGGPAAAPSAIPTPHAPRPTTVGRTSTRSLMSTQSPPFSGTVSINATCINGQNGCNVNYPGVGPGATSTITASVNCYPDQLVKSQQDCGGHALTSGSPAVLMRPQTKGAITPGACGPTCYTFSMGGGVMWGQVDTATALASFQLSLGAPSYITMKCTGCVTVTKSP